jgi:hypothetical protein
MYVDNFIGAFEQRQELVNRQVAIMFHIIVEECLSHELPVFSEFCANANV